MSGRARLRPEMAAALTARSCLLFCFENGECDGLLPTLSDLPLDVVRLALSFLLLPPPQMAPLYSDLPKSPTVLASDLDCAQFMDVDKEGAIWLAVKQKHQIVRLDGQSGEIMHELAFRGPIGVALVPRHAARRADFPDVQAHSTPAAALPPVDCEAVNSEVLVVADSKNERICAVDINTGELLRARATYKPHAYPKGLYANRETGDVFVALVAPPGGRVELVNPVTLETLRSYDTEDSYAHDCVYSPETDRVHVATTGGLYSFVYSTGESLGKTISLDDVSTPQGVDTDIEGNILMVDQASKKGVVVFSPKGGRDVRFVLGNGFREPCGVRIDHASGDIFVSDEVEGTLSVMRSLPVD
jgi:DNA-binding beta-propeller fold protein YncE